MPDSDPRSRTNDLRALRRLAYGYPTGSWFVIHDRDTSILDDKEHRWIIAEEARGEASVPAFVRSVSSTTGLPHPRHPERHEPGCRLNRDGRICGRRGSGRTDIPWFVKARCLSAETYSCLEPNAWYIEEVERMRIAWQSSGATSAIT